VNEQKVAISRRTFGLLLAGIRNFLKSPVGGRAWLMLAALLALMLGINGMNVANSYVGRYFMSAIERRDAAGFTHFAWLYVAVFAGSTLTGVLFRFTEERLGLLWRDWLTRRITNTYIDRRLYLRRDGGETLSNPDQRITEDVRQLTTTTLSFVLMILNGTLTALSFSGVLWAISPKLFLIAILYALAGSGLAIWLGRPLIGLNYRQSDFEANFRAELIHTREEGEEIVSTNSEASVKQRLNSHIDGLVSNLRRVMAVNRNLNFFTSGYNYLIQLIPVLVVAPMFIDREVEFGVIGQSAMAFATLLGAFSLVITQFQAISSYASVVARLNEFVDYAEKPPSNQLPADP
jgi:vitamin B12/bleomycin/antimicrobial peptide transport system ATP-binding/permease protein